MTKRLGMPNLQCANVYVSTVEVVQYAPLPVLCASHCPEIALLKKCGNFSYTKILVGCKVINNGSY